MSTLNRDLRLLIIGLDGATFDLMDPWLEEGKLPVLAGLIERGVRAPLRSTIPPMTGTAWNTFMTGVNPGKHGVYDFKVLNSGSYDFHLVSSRDRRAPTMWSIFNEGGLRTGVYNVPMTYPAEAVDGYMVSGMAPSTDGKMIHPPDLLSKLHQRFGEDALNPKALAFSRQDFDLGRFSDELRTRAEMARFLMQSEPTEIFMAVFNHSDMASHYFIGDRSLTTADGRRIDDMVLHTHQMLDEAVGLLAGQAGDETNILIVSDHGSGIIDYWFDVNRFLMSLGLLSMPTALRNPRQTLKASAVRAGLNVWRKLPGGFKRRLWLRGGGRMKQFAADVWAANVDWEKSRAFAWGGDLQIRLNLKGREPEGTVEPSEYESLRDEILSALEAVRHPVTGAPLFRGLVFRREAVYEGPFVEGSADIVGCLQEAGVAVCHGSTQGDPLIPYGKEARGGPSWKGIVGKHRLDGIFIGRGPAFRSGESVEGLRIEDVAPLSLYLMGQAIPEHMDGHVPEAALRAEVLASRPMAKAAADWVPDTSTEVGYSDDEAAVIEERLKDLGYLE